MGFKSNPTPVQVLDKQFLNVAQHLATFEGTITVLENANEQIDAQCSVLQETADHYVSRIEHAQGEKARNTAIIKNLQALIGTDDGE